MDEVFFWAKPKFGADTLSVSFYGARAKPYKVCNFLRRAVYTKVCAYRYFQ